MARSLRPPGQIEEHLLESAAFTAMGGIAAGLMGVLKRRSSGITRERGARRLADRARQIVLDRLGRTGAVSWESDGTLAGYKFVSAGAEQLLGYPVEEWYSDSKFWEHHLHPADREEMIRLRSEAVIEGRSGELVYRMIGADGRTVWLRDTSEVTLTKKGFPARIEGWMVDITEERLTQMQLRAVFAASRALTQSSPVSDAANEVISAVCMELEWALGALWTIDDEGELIRCAKVWRESEEMDEFALVTLRSEFRRGTGLPGRVWEAGEPTWISDVVQDENFPRAPYADKVGLHGAFGVPVRSAGNLLGVLEFFNRAVLERDDALLDMMDSIALQMGQFIQRHRVENRLKARNERMELLAEAGVILASSSDTIPALMSRIGDLMVRRLADWCAIHMREESGSISTAIILHTDKSKTGMTEELQRNYPPRPDDTAGPAKVLRTGDPEFYPSVPTELIDMTSSGPRHKELLSALGFASQIITPLRARGRILGTITLARSESSPRFDREDLNLAQEFANRTALAVDNIRLYAAQRHIATTLQESLRPRLVERIPGMELAVRYAAPGEGIEVGGDFYDVFSYGQKRWAVVIGDVSGRGARAAALTPLIKYTVRSEAMHEREPSRILTLLNEAMLQQSGEDQFCTVAYSRIDPRDDGVYITTVCAGHPSPLILRSHGEVERLGEPGTVLGAVPEVDLTEHLAELRQGDAMILFTDGAIEARRNGENFGEARLIASLSECAALGAEAIAERLEQSIIEYSEGSLSDDMVLLVVKVTHG